MTIKMSNSTIFLESNRESTGSTHFKLDNIIIIYYYYYYFKSFTTPSVSQYLSFLWNLHILRNLINFVIF